MLTSVIAVVAVLAAWSLVAHRLEQWRLGAPMILVLAGIVVGLGTQDLVAETLNTQLAQRAAEVTLAILLFIDATDVRGGLFGHDGRSAARLLFVAMPLGLIAAVLLGSWLLPGLSWAVLVVIACVVVPIDFAPAASVLRDPRVPERVRNLLNVEAGYNDGIVTPVFIFALALAGDHTHTATPGDALASALPQAIKAILVGAAVGAVLALLGNVAERRGLMTEQSKRVVLVAAPLLAFTLSLAVGGNGFVSAFVCGVVFIGLRQSDTIRRDLELLDDVGFLLTAVMWFVFGAAAVVALSAGVSVGLVVYCVLALTLVRLVPVWLAMLGSRFGRGERLLLAVLGPRGTTSIVLGLLAFNVLAGEAEEEVLLTMVVVVAGSVLMHGLAAPVAARAFAPERTPKL